MERRKMDGHNIEEHSMKGHTIEGHTHSGDIMVLRLNNIPDPMC